VGREIDGLTEKQTYCVRFTMSSTEVNLFDDTSKIRRLTNVDNPSIFAIPLWLKYSSSRAMQPCIPESRLTIKFSINNKKEMVMHTYKTVLHLHPNHKLPMA